MQRSAVAGETRQAVIAAVAGNVLIAGCKFVAAALSGSAAMLAEAIHSLVDGGNDALMLYGMRVSRRPPDRAHPFGYGHELYFWTLIVGVLIFGLGGGMSIVTGAMHLASPSPSRDAGWSYTVIAAAAIFEGASWWYGLKAFRTERRGRGVLETIRLSKDPTTFSVLLEDSAALAGLGLAFAGIFLSRALEKPWIDGACSLLIGLLLCAVALVMVYESKELLVGEGMERRTLETLRGIVQADPGVERVDRMLTQYLGPDEVMLAMEVRFRSEATIADIRPVISRLKQAIRERYPRIRRIFLDTASIGE